MAEPNKKKKIKGFKEFDPKKYIETKPVLDEAVKSTAVISFGRMNPVTIGHEKLVNKVTSEASKRKADPLIFLSHSQDKKKNPLTYDDKIKYATKAFGSVIKKSNAKTIIQIAQSLEGKYKDIVMVVGSDRVKEFDSLLNKYNGKDYNFNSITVISAGDRDPDADDVSGMSASKMRELASNNKTSEFSKGLPKRLQSDAATIMSAVRKGMNMSESEEIHIDHMEELDEALNRMQRRKRAIAMKKARFKVARGREKAKKRTASQQVLLKRARKAAIGFFKKKFAKNRRYAELSSGEKEVIDKRIEKISKKRIAQIARKLLPKVKQKERDRKRSMMTGGSSKNESVQINEASCADTKVRKKPHMLLNKEGKVKFDGRFKLYKKKVNESTEDLTEELNDLIESVESLDETTISATKRPVNITGPDGKTRTVYKKTRSSQTDDHGHDKIKTNEEKDTHKTKDGRTAKKGLWYNIHQKRKRGEKPAKPGDKDYPKTLDIEEENLDEKLKASDSMGTWIKDFQDSDAPQFKGKSKEKKRQMAIAAALDARRGKK